MREIASAFSEIIQKITRNYSLEKGEKLILNEKNRTRLKELTVKYNLTVSDIEGAITEFEEDEVFSNDELKGTQKIWTNSISGGKDKFLVALMV